MKLGSSLRRRRKGTRRMSDRLRVAAWIAGMALVGFGIGYLLATRVLFPAPETPDDLVETPALLGLELTEARGALEEAGLVLASVDSMRHPSVHPGRILGQSPLPGQLTVPAGSVRLTLSRGPQRTLVPDVYSLRGPEALAVLEASGFRVAVDSVEDRLPKGSVVRVEPPPGTEVAVPTEVRLGISLGPALVDMPSLVGLQEEEAMQMLDSLGLVVSEVETRFRFGQNQGTVLEQEPAAETAVERGSAVRLVVARRGGEER